MTSSATTKDLSKIISVFLPTASLPLPDDLTQVIDAYLEKHAQYDEGAADRLQEELLSIWEKTVRDKSQYASYLAILRRLLPALRNPAYHIQWWDTLSEPILNHLVREKGLVDEAWANVLAILTFDNEGQGGEEAEDGAHQIAIRLLDRWMHAIQNSEHGGNAAEMQKEKLIRSALLSYGKRRPKGLLAAMNIFILKRDSRPWALTLLCEFIQSQPPHLHVVLETQLSDSVLKCLQNDTSTTVVTLAVTAVTMLLPNMPSSLVPHLPNLFNVYIRLLFWDREISLTRDEKKIEPDSEMAATTSNWESLVYDPDLDGLAIPNLLNYFTVLYGLYPLNFVDYIRKPQRYLRHANAPFAENIEAQPSEIQQRSERFRQYHILHPNFYSMTVESEKTDFSRFIKSEASEVVADCTALCLATESGLGNDFEASHESNANGKTSAKDGTDNPSMSSSHILERSISRGPLSGERRQFIVGSPDVSLSQETIRRVSQSSRAPSTGEAFETSAREIAGDSPTLPPGLVLSPSHTQLQDMINSNKAIKTGLQQTLANDSVASLALSHQDSVPEKISSKLTAPTPVSAPPIPAEQASEQNVQLHRRILLLNNDLNFERYMKQQHMIHIGELRRRQLKEAATEAETQNLIMVNRNLKYRLEEAKRAEIQAKKESDNRRNLAKKWESDLSTKLKLLRENQKKWNSEGAALKRDLDTKTEECERLTKIVCGYETTDLNSKQNLEAINTHVEEIERLNKEVARLIEVEQFYQAKEKETDARLNEASEAISQGEMVKMKLDARETELQEAKELYETQIADLNAKLHDALQGGSGTKRNGDADKRIESMLAASRAKQADLQKQHSSLMRKYTTLQSSLLDITANTPRSSRMVVDGSSDADVSAIIKGRSVSPVRTRLHCGFSDSELSLHKPLDSYAGTSVGSAVHRPSTPLSSSNRDSSTGGTPRKDKREKKPTGIRGIRGFV